MNAINKILVEPNIREKPQKKVGHAMWHCPIRIWTCCTFGVSVIHKLTTLLDKLVCEIYKTLMHDNRDKTLALCRLHCTGLTSGFLYCHIIVVRKEKD